MPWSLFTFDGQTEMAILDVAKETLKNAEGFDKDDWPLTDRAYLTRVYEYYDVPVYWEA